MTHPSDNANLHPTYGLQTTVTPTERGAAIPQYRIPDARAFRSPIESSDEMMVERLRRLLLVP